MIVGAQMDRNPADIGVIGLAVMGTNLVLNMNDNGFSVCVYNRTANRTAEFLEEEAKGTLIRGATSVEELVSNLKTPKRILLMVKSGKPVDDCIDQLLPHLSKGDVIIDGGNSNYADTERRVVQLAKREIHYIGCGISGGEEGARFGPSIMPGGSHEAWQHVRDIFQRIAAKAPEDSLPCCEWIGNGGSGHFVKMVHNGIEYADMQIICEAYDIMRKRHGMTSKQMSQVFSSWNKGRLNSFLIEITASILEFCVQDEDGSEFMPMERILDVAGQKGTGKLTVQASLEYGANASVIAEAVYARILSGLKTERHMASHDFASDEQATIKPTTSDLQMLHDAVYASKIMAYAQGFMLLDAASTANNWNLNFQNIASIWRNGCIIRSAFLGRIADAYKVDPNLKSLLTDSFFKQELRNTSSGLRATVCVAVQAGIPVSGMASSLSFFDAYRCDKLPVNLLQAMRDYFGAHTFEYEEAPGIPVHIQWTQNSGKTSSSTYNA